MTKDKTHKPPKRTKGDAVHSVARGVLSVAPYIGGPAAELFNQLIVPPLEKRRNEWMEEVAADLEALADQKPSLDLGSLRENDEFISTVMHASQAAIRNHQAEKREALRNAVLNVAAGLAPDESVQMIFLDLIDSFTPWHLRILKLLHDPNAFGGAGDIFTGGLGDVLEATFSELRGQREFYDVIARDLFARGLTNTESFHVTMSGQGLRQKRTTEMGDAFLRFMTSPIDKTS